MEDFKISLKAARVNSGLTLAEACEKLNISKPTLIRYEKGITCPNYEKLKDICNLYQVPIAYIFLH